MEDLKQLVHKRGQIKSRLTRFRGYFNTFTEQQDPMQLKLRLSRFEGSWQDFEEVQGLIELQDQTQSSSNEREEFEKGYFDLLTEVEAFLSSRSTIAHIPQPTNNTEGSAGNFIRLPTINLPSFSGAYDQWLGFRDTFASLIHANPSLAGVQKFHYLRSALKGDAAQVIESLEISTSNYELAWGLLKERYEKNRWIIQNHTKALFDLPVLTKESHVGLRHLVDSTLKHLRALKTLNQPVDFWDTLIIHLTTTKLDNTTRREWETLANCNEKASFDDLIKFLSQRCHLLETLDQRKVGNAPRQPIKTSGSGRFNQSSVSNVATQKPNCPMCRQLHPLYLCKEFLKLAIDQRINKVKQLALCFNCLKGNHRSDKCDAGSCKKCSKKHNTLLHLGGGSSSATDASDQTQAAIASVPDGQATTSVANLSSKKPLMSRMHIILSTAVVEIVDHLGKAHHCRALLDSGSQSNFITESMCELLGLKINAGNIPVTGIGQSVVKVNKLVQATIKSRFNEFQATITCLVLPKITENLPSVNFDINQLKIPDNLRLADPQPGVSSEINLLIGAEIFYSLLCVGQIRTSRVSPTLQKTHLGWVLSGGLGINCYSGSPANVNCNLNLEDQLAKFWHIEENPQTSLTAEERACEDHFCKTVTRDINGRFIVKLPLKNTVGCLGLSRDIAIKRLFSLEKKFRVQPTLKEQYIRFMQEYSNLGHMEQVQFGSEGDAAVTYYLPHHAVIKSSSSTTKLRVVFDGSAETTSGISLNRILMVGPTTQQDLFSLLTRFRTHKHVLTADVAKMYRQIWVDTSQTDLQRIVWRESTDQPIATYRLKTVTYGTASAPFLATRCLQKIAADGRDEFPLASIVTSRDFYVDDLLTGTDSIQEAFDLRNQLISMLETSGFELRKWSSNTPELLSDLPADAVDTSAFQVDRDDTPKTLGLVWNSIADTLQYTVQPSETKGRVTKRVILSTIARIFDPLGLVGPVILKAKIMMQHLWQFKLGWDESVPIDVFTAWVQYEQQLTCLNSLDIQRRISHGIESPSRFELHGFCDASEAAYGACLYIKSVDISGNISVHLLCSRSRVAPMKTISLPRLELCGALLLAQLTQRTMSTLGLKIEASYLWTDSTIVIAWLSSPSNTWKTFVANRVSEIQDLTGAAEWRHVGTRDNPADHISRGTTPHQLANIKLWWHGPAWLTENYQDWPDQLSTPNAECDIPEKRAVSTMVLVSHEKFDFVNNYSSLRKLQRVTAYILRFKANASVGKERRLSGPLCVDELTRALQCLVKLVQAQDFGKEFKALNNGNELPSTSKLISLHPFLDDTGILRVGGRLKNAPIPYTQKHPILLPSGHHFTKLVVIHEHLKQLHAGQQSLLASIRTKYWPLAGRSLVRQIVRNCIRCFRAKPHVLEQFMADLPTKRVSPARAFSNCGVDYCGPFYLRVVRRRGCATFKTYISIFVCLCTKAVHLELVNDLTTEAFLGALKRFISRRGKCQHIFSDNATNFVGANSHLVELGKLMKSEDHQHAVSDMLAQDNITWHFIPANAPHFGGLWEAAVRSAKHHLRRVAGNASLTIEEMLTLIAQIEACMNSRPLTPLSDSPEDLNVLTPGHFLIGESLTAINEPDLTTKTTNRLSHWQQVQQLTQHFWSRWSVEYLSQLQQRTKWMFQKQIGLVPGSLVILKDDHLPPLKWKLGRITDLHPGSDGLTRVVSVRTATGIIRRAISKICLLPLETNPIN